MHVGGKLFARGASGFFFQTGGFWGCGLKTALGGPGVEDNQPRFAADCSLLRASLRAVHCGVYMGLLSSGVYRGTSPLRERLP